ncbi:MAG: hypothetical protein Q9219_005152 [cf. Caloplaca sp. 3 TL-2023]
MHDVLIKAMTCAYAKLVEDGSPWDRRLRAEELPFEFDESGAASWYYVDVQVTPPGILTWQKLRMTFEGLLLCALHRRQYHAIHFEVWEQIEGGADHVRVGNEDFGMKEQSAVE